LLRPPISHRIAPSKAGQFRHWFHHGKVVSRDVALVCRHAENDKQRTIRREFHRQGRTAVGEGERCRWARLSGDRVPKLRLLAHNAETYSPRLQLVALVADEIYLRVVVAPMTPQRFLGVRHAGAIHVWLHAIEHKDIAHLLTPDHAPAFHFANAGASGVTPTIHLPTALLRSQPWRNPSSRVSLTAFCQSPLRPL